jgi:hypothetical protein
MDDLRGSFYHVFITATRFSRLRLTPRHHQETGKLLKTNGGSVCESNTPATSWMPPAGFEDRDDHRTACASVDFANFLPTNSLRTFPVGR